MRHFYFRKINLGLRVREFCCNILNWGTLHCKAMVECMCTNDLWYFGSGYGEPGSSWDWYGVMYILNTRWPN